MDSNQKKSESLKRYWENAKERKEELAVRLRGKNNPAKRLDVRKKISESKRGKRYKHIHPLSEKQRIHLLRLAELKRGKKLNLETRMKISISRKGKCKGPENPLYGKRHTEAIIKKIKRSRQLRRDRHLQDIFRKAKELGFNLNTNLKHDETRNDLQKYNKINSLGYIIGTIPTDAYFGIPSKRNNYVYSISAKDKDFIETVVECLNNFKIIKKIRRQRNLWRIQTSKKQIEQFLAFIKKEKDDQWVFDENVFNLDQYFRRSILMAVCDAEGCVTNSSLKGNIISRHITITNSSLLLLKQIKLLLESFGIQSYICHHRKPRMAEIRGRTYQFKKHVFTLTITGYQNLQKFKNIIGFSIKRKQGQLEYILSSYKKIHRCYSPNNYDLILQLSKYFSNCSDISRLTNISPQTVRNWVLHSIKPRSIKMRQTI